MSKTNIECAYTPKEEFIHSLLHGIGMLFSIFAIPYLVWVAAHSDSTLKLVSSCVYAFGFLMTFTFSTLYHGSREGRQKNIFHLLDYISIYFLIAGTYTPLVVNYMFNFKGWLLLSSVWLCSFCGIILKVFFAAKFQVFSVGLYLLIGLMFLFVIKDFFASMPADVITLIIGGGALYLIGVIFYVNRQWKNHHAVWHLLTLVASLCHFAAVLQSFRR